MRIREYYNKIKDGIPGVLPAVAAHFLFYFSPQFIVPAEKLFPGETALDKAIPFVPFFVLFYAAAYFQWILYYLRMAGEDRQIRRKYVAAEVAGKFLAFFVFVFYPVSITRPELSGNGLFIWMLKFIYSADTPMCLLPSIHCFQGWLCMRYAIERKGKAEIAVTAVFTLLVFASTVLVKQHLLIDILAGTVLAELCLQLSGAYFRRKASRTERGLYGK